MKIWLSIGLEANMRCKFQDRSVFLRESILSVLDKEKIKHGSHYKTNIRTQSFEWAYLNIHFKMRNSNYKVSMHWSFEFIACLNCISRLLVPEKSTMTHSQSTQRFASWWWEGRFAYTLCHQCFHKAETRPKLKEPLKNFQDRHQLSCVLRWI